MKKGVCIALLAGLCGALQALPLPDWYIPLRDAIYEQKLNADGVAPLYRAAKQRAEQTLSGSGLQLMLSRCEYMMGRALQYDERKREAADCYARGIDFAQKGLDSAGDAALSANSAGLYQMLAENISQSCAVRSTAWVMANGLKVEEYSKKALEADPENIAALYMIAARWVFAPSPFNDLKKGLTMMQAIANDHRERRSPVDSDDDRFNVYSAIGYAFYQQKKYGEAKQWFDKALLVYPSNKYVGELAVKCL